MHQQRIHGYFDVFLLKTAVLLKGLNRKAPPPKPKSAKMRPNFFFKKTPQFSPKTPHF